jgi:hypothetical protein
VMRINIPKPDGIEMWLNFLWPVIFAPFTKNEVRSCTPERFYATQKCCSTEGTRKSVTWQSHGTGHDRVTAHPIERPGGRSLPKGQGEKTMRDAKTRKAIGRKAASISTTLDRMVATARNDSALQ